MYKFVFSTFALALNALLLLKKNNIPACYWPDGGDMPRLCKPVIHQVAIDERYQGMATNILQSTGAIS